MEQQKPPLSKEEDVKRNKDVAAFGYVWVMSVLVYFGRKDSPFIQHHSKQGMILFLLTIPVWFIPILGQLLEIVLLAGMVMGFINAFQGQWTDVPVVGPLSRGEMSLGQAFKTVWNFLAGLFRQASKSVEKNETKSEPAQEKPPAPATPPSPPPSQPVVPMPPPAEPPKQEPTVPPSSPPPSV